MRASIKNSLRQLRAAALVYLLILVVIACNSQLDVKVNSGKLPLACSLNIDSTACNDAQGSTPSMTRLSPMAAKPGENVVIEGQAFSLGMMISIEGRSVKPRIIDANHASFTMPGGLGAKIVQVSIDNNDDALPLISNDAKDGLPFYSGDAHDICSDQKFHDANGALVRGLKPCPSTNNPECDQDGQINCLVTGDLSAAKVQGLADYVMSGQTVAGVSGTVTLPHPGLVYRGTKFGPSGAALTGALTLPPASTVQLGSPSYGIPGNLQTPTFTPPTGTSVVIRPDSPVITTTLTTYNPDQITLSWKPVSGATGYIVAAHKLGRVSWSPTDGISYALGPIGAGADIVIYSGSATFATLSMPLPLGHIYNFVVYSYRNNFIYSSSPAVTQGGSFYPTCADILSHGLSVGDGTYFVDPDGAQGPLASMQVYCDMTSDGGGWTLVAASNPSNGRTPLVDALPNSSSYGLLNVTALTALAQSATSVRIMAPAYAADIISADSYPISRLRQYVNLNDDSNMSNPSVHWISPPSNLTYSCTTTRTSTETLLTGTIYHACGNGFGFHWMPGIENTLISSTFNYDESITPLSLWIK